jgi:hypothetical protein
MKKPIKVFLYIIMLVQLVLAFIGVFIIVAEMIGGGLQLEDVIVDIIKIVTIALLFVVSSVLVISFTRRK